MSEIDKYDNINKYCSETEPTPDESDSSISTPPEENAKESAFKKVLGYLKKALSVLFKLWMSIENAMIALGNRLRGDKPHIEESRRRRRIRIVSGALAFIMIASTIMQSTAMVDFTKLTRYFGKKDAEFYYTIASEQLEAGHYERAMKNILKSEALAEKEDLPAIYALRAQYEIALGNNEAAMEYLEDYLVQVPTDASLRSSLAQYYVQYKDYEKALAHYSILIRQGMDTLQAYYLQGVCAMECGKYVIAEEAFDNALTKGEPEEKLYYYRGVCAMANGKYKKAAEDFTSELKINKEMSQTLRMNRGLCYLYLGKYNDAAVDLIYAAYAEDADKTVSDNAKKILNEYFVYKR